jgi:hypothetical protein
VQELVGKPGRGKEEVGRSREVSGSSRVADQETAIAAGDTTKEGRYQGETRG